MNRVKAIYRSWGIPCAGQQRVRTTLSLGVARQDPRSRRASPGGDLLPAVGRVAVAAPASAARSARRRPEAQRAGNCYVRFRSIGPIRAALLIALMQTPHRFRTKRQLWTYIGSGSKTSQQCRASLVSGRAAARQEACLDSRAEPQSQSRSEECIQGCCHRGRCQGGPVPRVLRCVAGQGNPAGDGAADVGAQDGGHHLTRLEERSALRRPTSETTNSLNVSGQSVPSWNFFRWWRVGFWRHSGSRVSLQLIS